MSSVGLDKVFSSLPVLNGNIEGGIAAGLDESLAQDDRLPVLRAADGSMDRESAKAISLRWAYSKFSRNSKLRKLAVCAVVITYDLGLIAADDSDITCIGPEHPLCSDDSNDERIRELVDKTGYSQAATVILSTKASWWLSNHHTGQGKMVGYPAKVAKVMFEDVDQEEAGKMFHTIGRWASTRLVLKAAGLQGILDSEVIFEAAYKLELSDDAKLRFSGFPSGTHKIANAYAGARRLVGSMYYGITPEGMSIRDILKPYDRIRANRASYHVGAQFLTGRPRLDAGEEVAESMLGRVGTYLRIIMPRSTLTESPHFAADRVQSYTDYDGDFESRLTAQKAKQATMTNVGMDRLIAGFDVLSSNLAREVAEAFGVPLAYGVESTHAEVDLDETGEGETATAEEVTQEPEPVPRASKRKATTKHKSKEDPGPSKKSRKK